MRQMEQMTTWILRRYMRYLVLGAFSACATLNLALHAGAGLQYYCEEGERERERDHLLCKASNAHCSYNQSYSYYLIDLPFGVLLQSVVTVLHSRLFF